MRLGLEKGLLLWCTLAPQKPTGQRVKWVSILQCLHMPCSLPCRLSSCFWKLLPPPGALVLPPCTGTIPMAWQVLATFTGKGLARPLLPPAPSSFLQNGLNFAVKRIWTSLTLKTQEP